MLLEACPSVFLSTEAGEGRSGSVVWFCCRWCEVLLVVGIMVSIGRSSFGGGIGTCVQSCNGVAWSGGTPLVVMARLSFSSLGVVCAARFLWYSSSASGLVASDTLLKDLHGIFVDSTWCLLFRLRSAASGLLEFFLLIHASRLFQKMTRASLDSMPENVEFFEIPVHISGSNSE